MALLLETVWGDLVIDLDVEGSPDLCKNLLKLAKARYFTKSLIFEVSNGGYCRTGCPRGDGKGGASIYGYLDSSSSSSSNAEKSPKRFLRSQGRRLTEEQVQVKGRVVAMEVQGVPDTIGSQFAIALRDDNLLPEGTLSLGKVVEDDDDVLDKIAAAYCDPEGRPYADIRIMRALVIEDPFEDPTDLDELMKRRGVAVDNNNDRVIDSPSPERPPEELVAVRIQADEVDDEEDETKLKEREEAALRKEDRSRAVVLEMLGDLPDADIKAPENVLFICKLNPVTQDEDLELIFSRFDPQVKVEIIRDHETGRSLQYAFAEFREKQQAVEAYFKMNNALVDDRRIKVDFSQSVAKIWDKYNQKMKMPTGGPDGSFGRSGPGQRGGPPSSRGRGRGRSSGNRRPFDRSQRDHHDHSNTDREKQGAWHSRREFDEFGRRADWERSQAGDRRYEDEEQRLEVRERGYHEHDRPDRHRDGNYHESDRYERDRHGRKYSFDGAGHGEMQRRDRHSDDDNGSRDHRSHRHHHKHKKDQRRGDDDRHHRSGDLDGSRQRERMYRDRKDDESDEDRRRRRRHRKDERRHRHERSSESDERQHRRHKHKRRDREGSRYSRQEERHHRKRHRGSYSRSRSPSRSNS